jgi:hypothetical protein
MLWPLDDIKRMDCTPDTAYWRFLADDWDIGRRFNTDTVIVEQDIVPAPGVVERMLACRRPWCASPYVIGAGTVLADGLGCTKFAARLKTRHPDLMEQVGRIDDDGLPAKNWRRLDTRISRLLRQLGYRPHVHARSEHLHDYRTRP